MSELVLMSAPEARTLTDRIKVGVEAVWDLITTAYTERAWAVLGYQSWDDYCTREFGTSRLRLPREERQEVVASLRESGLSIRAIAAATGLGRGTVEREVEEPVPNGTPEPRLITGTDGKTYTPKLHEGSSFARGLAEAANDQTVSSDWLDTDTADAEVEPQPAAPRRKALTDQARDAGWDLRKAVERLERIAADDRFEGQKEKVTRHLRGHLANAIEVCQDLLDRIETTN